MCIFLLRSSLVQNNVLLFCTKNERFRHADLKCSESLVTFLFTLNIFYSSKKVFVMKGQPWQRCKLKVMTNYHFYYEWNNVSLSSISSSIQEIRADNWANTNNSFFISYFQTAQQLNSTYEERCRHSNFTSHEYASFTYDAVWTIALMLDKSIPLLGEKNKTFETIKYGDKETAEIMKDILFRTNFTGMSVG